MAERAAWCTAAVGLRAPGPARRCSGPARQPAARPPPCAGAQLSHGNILSAWIDSASWIDSMEYRLGHVPPSQPLVRRDGGLAGQRGHRPSRGGDGGAVGRLAAATPAAGRLPPTHAVARSPVGGPPIKLAPPLPTAHTCAALNPPPPHAGALPGGRRGGRRVAHRSSAPGAAAQVRWRWLAAAVAAACRLRARGSVPAAAASWHVSPSAQPANAPSPCPHLPTFPAPPAQHHDGGSHRHPHQPRAAPHVGRWRRAGALPRQSGHGGLGGCWAAAGELGRGRQRCACWPPGAGRARGCPRPSAQSRLQPCTVAALLAAGLQGAPCSPRRPTPPMHPSRSSRCSPPRPSSLPPTTPARTSCWPPGVCGCL